MQPVIVIPEDFEFTPDQLRRLSRAYRRILAYDPNHKETNLTYNGTGKHSEDRESRHASSGDRVARII